MHDENRSHIRTWQTVHASFQGLAADKAAYQAAEAYWLREGHAVRVWEGVGCASYSEYVSRMLGYRRHKARDRIRTALALGALPAIEEAIAEGRVSWSAARELTRVATPATEQVWLDAADGHTVREIEEMVAGLSPGDLPGAARDRSVERRVLRFEVTGATYAAFREAEALMQREAGHGMTQDELIDLIARRILAGLDGRGADPGRSSYQLAVTRCSDCAKTHVDAAGTQVEIDAATAAAVECDVQTVPAATHVGHPQRSSQSIPPRVRRAVMRAYHNRCAVPGCRHASYLDVHHIELRSEKGGHDFDNLVPMCSAHHRASHAGRLVIERTPIGLVFRHPDGTRYGRPAAVDANVAAVRTQVFQALVNLGFRQKQARGALDVIDATGSFEQVMRAALAVLRPRSRARDPRFRGAGD
ncbi:MAG TPA: HNH endonuclease [Kofleriaceae bacterium]|nr:HNH endonuclease [Kofleriaceae bacterium]